MAKIISFYARSVVGDRSEVVVKFYLTPSLNTFDGILKNDSLRDLKNDSLRDSIPMKTSRY